MINLHAIQNMQENKGLGSGGLNESMANNLGCRAIYHALETYRMPIGEGNENLRLKSGGLCHMAVVVCLKYRSTGLSGIALRARIFPGRAFPNTNLNPIIRAKPSAAGARWAPEWLVFQ